MDHKWITLCSQLAETSDTLTNLYSVVPDTKGPFYVRLKVISGQRITVRLFCFTKGPLWHLMSNEVRKFKIQKKAGSGGFTETQHLRSEQQEPGDLFFSFQGWGVWWWRREDGRLAAALSQLLAVAVIFRCSVRHSVHPQFGTPELTLCGVADYRPGCVRRLSHRLLVYCTNLDVGTAGRLWPLIVKSHLFVWSTQDLNSGASLAYLIEYSTNNLYVDIKHSLPVGVKSGFKLSRATFQAHRGWEFDS